MNKNLLTLQHWNEYEIRMEIDGNGHYIRKVDLGDWIKGNAKKMATEILCTANTTEPMQ